LLDRNKDARGHVRDTLD